MVETSILAQNKDQSCQVKSSHVINVFRRQGCPHLGQGHGPIVSSHHNKSKVKSCYNPLRLGTVIVLVSSGVDFVNTPRLYSDRATR